MAEVVKPKVLDLSRLARDIAMDILRLDDVLKLHQIDQQQWEEVAKSPVFGAMLQDMQRAWLSAENTKERVKFKAQTGVETILEELVLDCVDKDIPLAQRVEMAKLLTKLGELGEAPSKEMTGERVVIQINVGTLGQTIEAKAIPSRDAEDVVNLNTT